MSQSIVLGPGKSEINYLIQISDPDHAVGFAFASVFGPLRDS